MSAVHSFDLTPSSFIYDDGRWITPCLANILFRGKGREGGRGAGGGGTITFMSAVLSFDLTPSSVIYDDGRWITTWRVKILFVGEERGGGTQRRGGFHPWLCPGEKSI